MKKINKKIINKKRKEIIIKKIIAKLFLRKMIRNWKLIILIIRIQIQSADQVYYFSIDKASKVNRKIKPF